MSYQGGTDVRPVTIIRSSAGWGDLRLRELWEYRDLLYFLLWREVKGRYRQMALGPLWIVLSPLANVVIFSVIFGGLAGLPSDGVPYPLFTYVALLPWRFFASAAGNSANCLVNQQHLIAKVYFPRLVVPVSAVMSAFVDFLASFAVLAGMMAIYRVGPSWTVLVLPLYLLLAAGAALAVGLWLAGLSVKFRDVSLGLNFALTGWMYLTPVAYTSSLIPEQWRSLYRLNPMAGVVEGFRWALLGVGNGPDWAVAAPALLVAGLLVAGTYYFRFVERTIVDLL